MQLQKLIGVIRLSQTAMQELQDTTHVKNYKANTLANSTEYVFLNENDSFFLIIFCFEKANLMNPLDIHFLGQKLPKPAIVYIRIGEKEHY